MKTTHVHSSRIHNPKTALKPDTSHIRQHLFPAIFKITHASGSGSCFYLKKYNLFITNHHVVEGFRQIAIEDHSRHRYLAHVFLSNPGQDIALLKTGNDFSFLPDI
ncbi:MAG: serine protease, partial [Odoribacter sp.]|nr:serine protease [Odoribacter sp.]